MLWKDLKYLHFLFLPLILCAIFITHAAFMYSLNTQYTATSFVLDRVMVNSICLL